MTIERLTNRICIYQTTSHAFGTSEEVPVGSIVRNPSDLIVLDLIEKGLETCQFNDKGQGFIVLPKSSHRHIACGDGLRKPTEMDDEDLSHFRLARSRNRVDSYLRREYAGETQFAGVVIYTREGFKADPEVGDDMSLGCCHVLAEHAYVIVAVIASCTGDALPAWTLVNNMSGNNADFLLKSAAGLTILSAGDKVPPGTQLDALISDAQTAHKWVAKAKATIKQWTEYSVVAG